MKTKIRQIKRLLTEAYKKSNEERAWDLYLTKYPNMDEKTFKSFDEFYKSPQENEESTDTKSAEQILNDVKDLMNSHSWR